ncbi:MULTISPECIES: VWA domain-containing protein [Streptosporangium]|uniref:Ca-activated chloride channel family protein n=1 Tax=Streptosporangium brasiliense TaxID=47480 RepID=A0ABT9QYT3_9ACTN|nr:VWA domain-containing protein [Streptosporangium brasiliense]MDP9862140.1 Ca-activated chloride channel family protein [Streptosporangium brasiliense]
MSGTPPPPSPSAPAGPSSRRRAVRSAVRRAAAALALLALATPVACSSGDAPEDGPDVLRVLAGSEVKDLEPMLRRSGVRVKISYTGTLDGAEQVAAGGADGSYDAIWFSSNRYLSLIDGATARLSTETKIMSSPVVLGLTDAKARELGWAGRPVTWEQIATAAREQRFTFGMANPASSNSGFSALVGVAAALSDAGEALSGEQVAAVTPRLKEFFSAQRLTSGSSGWLADAYSREGGVDGIVNYESVLLGLEGLSLIHPSDGVVTADYPLTLLASARPEKKELYGRLTGWLRRPDTQREIMTATHRRPIVPGVRPGPEFGTAPLLELPFPNRRAAADALITAYLDEARVPARALFVLDTSGSMDGERIEALRQALITLTGADTSASGTFSRFRSREDVVMIPFSGSAGQPQPFALPERDPQPVLARIRAYAENLRAGGGTAIFDGLRAAYGQAAGAGQGRYTSVVLMTDGENTDGISYDDFELFYRTLPRERQQVRTFVVLFGESDVEEMRKIAKLTRGAVFDARSGSLASAFKEIRGYQ